MTPLEKAARALFDNMYNGTELDYDGLSDLGKQNLLVVASAVIAAIRDADEGMLKAGVAARYDGDPDEKVPLTGTGQGDLQIVPAWEDAAYIMALNERWQAMINQILEG